MASTPGLAQIAFMQREQAVRYLATECVPVNPDTAALEAEWDGSVARLGAPIANFGTPTISDVPQSHQGYVAQLRGSPDWHPMFAANPHWELKLVEAAPLLAYQFSVLDGTANDHGTGLSAPPTLDELLNACLPLAQAPEDFSVVQQHNSALIRSKSLNLRPLQFGMVSPGCFMLQVGGALPFVHVVRFNGRCYLHNGYHRTYAALRAGATVVPCIFRDVVSEQEIGLSPGTFSLATLESPNPPTMHHFVSGQAQSVDLIVKMRTIHLNWTDWVVPEV